MALSKFVASELLEAFRAGEGMDLIRESVRLVMQELIETETTERIGASWSGLLGRGPLHC
jgi:putative transposase